MLLLMYSMIGSLFRCTVQPPALRSAELAAICSKLGRIPTRDEYMADMGVLTASSGKIYQYLNFDKVKDYTDMADTVKETA